MLVVLSILGGLAFLGHSTNWKVPKFSAIVTNGITEEEAWCVVHNVPEEECIECLPSLLPLGTDYGWCDEHGVNQCPLEHPDVLQTKETPSITEAEKQRVAEALLVQHRTENNSGSRLYRNRVQFASTKAVMKAGIDVDLVERKPVKESIMANGEIKYDETRVAQLSSRVPGTVWRVSKKIGDRVKKGEVIALIDSAAIGDAKAKIMDAQAEWEFSIQKMNRLKPLAQKKAITASRFLESQTEYQKALIRLQGTHQALINLGLTISLEEFQQTPEEQRSDRLKYLGLPAQLAKRVATLTESNNLYPILAPQDGVITKREIVPGEVVDSEDVLFQIADISRMWLILNVSLEESSQLRLGQKVEFQQDGIQGELTGVLDWISTTIDPKTRTISVRSGLENNTGKLRNESFGVGHIILREDPEGIMVPSEAVQWDGGSFVVFVRDKHYFDEYSPKFFHTRTVRLGVKQDGFTEIIVGVYPGEVVATRGSGVLRAQILKNNLGAGCTCGQ